VLTIKDIEDAKGTRIYGASFYNVKGLTYHRTHERFISRLEGYKKNPKIDNPKRILSNLLYDEEKEELNIDFKFEVPKMIRLMKEVDGELQSTIEKFYEERRTTTVLGYSDRIMKIFSRGKRDAQILAIILMEAAGEGIYFEKVRLSKELFNYFIDESEEVQRIKLEVDEGEHRREILISGKNANDFSVFENLHKLESTIFKEIGLLFLSKEGTKFRTNITADGRITVYGGMESENILSNLELMTVIVNGFLKK
jgi:hypothetical protein